MSLDNSSCNLASLNLLKFLRDDDTFDAKAFEQAVELIITAMDILFICFADFPTEAIARTTRDYRQLGIGYANSGCAAHGYGTWLRPEVSRPRSSNHLAHDWCLYRRSAELAGIVGPYEGYARNADAHKRVMRKHQAANDALRTVDTLGAEIRKRATAAWDGVIKIGEANGYRTRKPQ